MKLQNCSVLFFFFALFRGHPFFVFQKSQSSLSLSPKYFKVSPSTYKVSHSTPKPYVEIKKKCFLKFLFFFVFVVIGRKQLLFFFQKKWEKVEQTPPGMSTFFYSKNSVGILIWGVFLKTFPTVENFWNFFQRIYC